MTSAPTTPIPNTGLVPDKILSLGLKKAALVLHALALKLDDPTAATEMLALVKVVSDAAKRFDEVRS